MTSEPEIYDLVLKGGRVIDPARTFDGVADAAIRNGRVAAKLPPHRAASPARSRRTSISASSRRRRARARRS